MNALETLLCLAAAWLAAVPLLWSAGGARWLGTGVAVLALGAAGLFPRFAPRPSLEPDVLSLLEQPSGASPYVSSRTCRRCHPDQYASWHATFHRTMTQPATPGTVVAPFDGRTLADRGRTYRVERRGEEFWVEMPDLDWEANLAFERGIDLAQVKRPRQVERRVVMTTGSHYMQTYWVWGSLGHELRQFPWTWHIEDERWIPKDDSFLNPPSDDRRFALWNMHCIECHSTAGRPQLAVAEQALYSEVAELGIACEACHGPAEAHVRKYRNPAARLKAAWSDSGDDPLVVHPARLSAERSSQICGRCHAYLRPRDEDGWWQHGYVESYRPGQDLSEASHILQRGSDTAEKWVRQIVHEGKEGGIDSFFWPDGTVRVGGREYPGLLESPCYERGEGARRLSCLSCHSMHSSEPDQQVARRMRGNRACTQCHTEPRFADRIERHTHHPRQSEGSRCYNCHMPHTSYALLRAIRSHRIDSPRIGTVTRGGRPNACNLCHLDRTLDWTQRNLAEWYAHEPVELGELERTVAASLLWLLRGDAAQRAVTAWSFGWKPAQHASGTRWMAPFVARLLDDPYSAVRFIAARSLRSLPGLADFEYEYLAPADERRIAPERALDEWQARSGLWRGAPAEVLFQPDGQLDEETVARLLSERDDRPISISE